MNPTSIVLRWYRQSTGAAHPRQQYTAQEVLQLLRPNDVSNADLDARQTPDWEVRGAAVRQVAAQPGSWLGELSKRHRQEIGPLADRLPSLVFHHAIGGDAGEMVRRFGGWSTWRYERALEVAGGCIARHLNGIQMA
jgi:hypothetical protein